MAFTILSYNIQEGGENRLPLIAGVIRDLNPDAVALLEANSRTNAEALASGLGMHLAYGEANSAFAVAWLSRLPIRRAENHRLPVLAKTLLDVDVVWEDRPLRLFAAHLGSRHDLPQPEEEVPVILDLLRLVAGQPHLLVGDFNYGQSSSSGAILGAPTSRRLDLRSFRRPPGLSRRSRQSCWR